MRRFLFIIPLLLAVSTVQAAYLDLAWDTNQEADLAGYKIYFGTSSGSYSHFADVGNVTSCRLENLADGVSYYLAATAYDTAGNKSPYSLEVFGAPFLREEIPLPSPTQVRTRLSNQV